VQGSPADVNLAYETVWISGGEENNQERLYGWWIPQNSQEAPVILYLHGNRGNLAVAPSFRNLQRVAKLHQLGFAILMIDYRGYGNSPGRFPTEAQVYQDAEWAWQYLVKIQNCQPSNIWVYGHSLGGAIAGHLCKDHSEAAGLIADGCFTSMADMARDTWLKIFPSDWLITQKFDLINYIKSLQIPVLFIHGTADRTVPSYMSEQLFAVACEPKQLYLVSGAGHDNLSEFAGQEYLDTLIKFITDYQRSSQLIELN
jgi:pimeloyl-ACP methyl ester carboxylesterase